MIEFSLLCLERFKKEGELEKILPFVDSIHLDIETYEAIVDACCEAWNNLLNETNRIYSIATRKWAANSQ